MFVVETFPCPLAEFGATVKEAAMMTATAQKSAENRRFVVFIDRIVLCERRLEIGCAPARYCLTQSITDGLIQSQGAETPFRRENMLFYRHMNRVSQYLVYPIVRFFTLFFITVEFRNPDGFKQIIGKPAIIVANHIAYYDTFLLRLNPYSVRGTSLFFMGVKSFNARYMRFLWTIGLVPLIYKIFGVFLVYPGQGLDKNLETPRKILAEKNQILIFPEGSVNISDTLRPFKKGAAVLASTMDIMVLPISYKRAPIAGKRKKVIVTIGEAMKFQIGTPIDIVNSQLQERINMMLAN
jgi:1-acyl-sn-glycerol-3-phosphate acyltransferase